MLSKLVSRSVLGVISCSATMFMGSVALAQVGGPKPVPAPHTCSACHPDWPNICDSVQCPGVNAVGAVYCGCTADPGTTPNGTPTVLAVCLYGTDCAE